VPTLSVPAQGQQQLTPLPKHQQCCKLSRNIILLLIISRSIIQPFFCETIIYIFTIFKIDALFSCAKSKETCPTQP
jgi:hypothetical protein